MVILPFKRYGLPQQADHPGLTSAGVRQFHGCYSIGDDELFGVVRHRKSAVNTLKALRSIRARRPNGETIYVILDNLSAHKGVTIAKWTERNNVELCFTPTYSSWANPIEAHFGPLREFVLNNSNHPNHGVSRSRINRAQKEMRLTQEFLPTTFGWGWPLSNETGARRQKARST